MSIHAKAYAMKNMLMNEFARKLVEEWFLSLTIIGVIVTSIYLWHLPEYTFNDLKIIYILFVFLIIIKGLEKGRFLEFVALKFEKGKFLVLKLVMLTGILSAFVTNDVALLTVVPFTLLLCTENLVFIIILETLTANAVSALTPFGNPQNIFIYWHYNITLLEFTKVIFPFTLVLFSFIILLSFKTKNDYQKNSIISVKLDKKSYYYLIFFSMFIFALLRILPLWVGIIPIMYAVVFDRKSLSVDYTLLAMFFLFFGFTDNLIHILRFTITNSNQIFLYSAILSQIMSNVPSTLFLADFTSNWKPLLWGVSVGGFGSLVGSLANLITYRLYKAKFRETKEFLIKFHLYSYTLFFIGITAYFIFSPLIF